MATVKQILDLLVAADDALSRAYSVAPQSELVWIDFCSRAIEGVIKDIVRSDLHSRTGQIESLTKELKKSTEELQALKQTVEKIVQAGKIAQEAINAAKAL